MHSLLPRGPEAGGVSGGMTQALRLPLVPSWSVQTWLDGDTPHWEGPRIRKKGKKEGSTVTLRNSVIFRLMGTF